jgi:L-histidine N-alpha-methyltransferase
MTLYALGRASDDRVVRSVVHSSEIHAVSMQDEVLAGLRHDPKTLPAKLFYDARGVELFDAIMLLDEYYLTRTEVAILSARADAIAARIGRGSVVIELGSGSGSKVRLLFDALRERSTPPAAYVPVDIAGEQLAELARTIEHDYRSTSVVPIDVDFTAPGALSTVAAHIDAFVEAHVATDGNGTLRRVVFFPGSTIGNLHPADASVLLGRLRNLCGPAGALLLGADLRKEPSILHAAYNDTKRITAAFNANILTRVNRECSANFDVTRFQHYAFYNPTAHRIEMHLASLEEQSVRVAGCDITFARGESIWTESSYKYDGPSMDTVLARGGWAARYYWDDSEGLFGVWYCEPVEG